MIPGIRQLGEVRVHGAAGDLAVPGNDGSPLADGDLDGVECLTAALATQFALTGSPEIADPVRFAIGRDQITAPE